ncbi:aldo/keto reductase [Roseivirga seohaensis]|uniref:aldo/keto reductase n=1 Tax=Roseivirga seohaensis TaxID=1914963 RepID=UPI003BA8D9EC
MSIIKKIALGTVQFGLDYGISNEHGKTEIDEIVKIIEYCKLKGIDTIDTAYAYGKSQEELGKNDLSSFKVVTKFLLEQSMESGRVKNSLLESLKLLNLKQVYGYLSHRPMELITNPNLWDELLEMKTSGKIKKIGFSFNELREAELVLDKGMIPDLIQIPFNYFDNRFKSVAEYMKRTYKTEVHVRSTFLQGLFFMRPSSLSNFFNPIKEPLTTLQKTENLTGNLLYYSASQSFIDKVVIGVNNLSQLELNFNALERVTSCMSETSYIIPQDILIPSKWQM